MAGDPGDLTSQPNSSEGTKRNVVSFLEPQAATNLKFRRPGFPTRPDLFLLDSSLPFALFYAQLTSAGFRGKRLQGGYPQSLGKENNRRPVAANESTTGSNESSERSSQRVPPEDRVPGSTVD